MKRAITCLPGIVIAAAVSLYTVLSTAAAPRGSVAPSPAPPSPIEATASLIAFRADAAEALAAAGDIPNARELLATNEKAIDDLQTKLSPDRLNELKKRNLNATTTTNSKSAAICGGGIRFAPCFYVGAFLASGSIMAFSIGNLHGGKTAHSLVSTAIPAVGVRLPLDSRARFSIELGLLSMVISKDVTPKDTRIGCKKTDGEFEKKLPCEGVISLSPVLGAYVGATVGTSDVGLVTIMPMLGAATTSLDDSVRFYGGLAVGLVNLNKTFNF
jgi:hypothetical protein